MATIAGSLASARRLMLRLDFGSERKRSTSAMGELLRLRPAHAFLQRGVFEIREGDEGRGGIERAIAIMRHRSGAWPPLYRDRLVCKRGGELRNLLEARDAAACDIEHAGRAAHQRARCELGDVVDV